MSLEEAIESALESFPNIDCLKDEQKKCIAALLQKKVVLGFGGAKVQVTGHRPQVTGQVTGHTKKQ